MTVEPGRQAILRAARVAFARMPYAAVTLRGIAADAGVSPALIVKHFGGKESLFDEIADFSAAADTLLATDNAELAHHAVLRLIEHRRTEQSDLLLRVVFAAGRADERSLIRQRFRDQVVRRLATRLHGADTELRAELFVAGLLGLGATMAVERSGPTATRDPAIIAARYAPSLQALIDAD